MTSKRNKMSKLFSVWVGGSEVNNYWLTINDAVRLADDYEDDGYDNIHILENVNDYWLTIDEAVRLADEYND